MKQIRAVFRYKDWSINVKLLTITIVLIVGSVVLVSLLSFYRYTIDFQEQSAARVQQIIEQLSFNIETYLDDLSRLSLVPLYNSQIMEILEQGTPPTELGKLEKRRMIEGNLDSMMIIPRKDILSVYILSDEIYRGGRYSAGVDSSVKYEDFDWYKQALTTDNVIFVPAHMEQMVSLPRATILSVVRSIRNIKNDAEILAVVKVDANSSGIVSLCNRVNMGSQGGLFIMDKNSTIIYSSLPGSLSGAPLEDLYQQVKNSSKPYLTTSLQGKRYLLNAVTIQSASWTIVALNSIDELNQSALQTRNMTYLFAVGSSLLAILVLWLFTHSFLQPLTTIISLMKEVKRGNFQVEFPEQRGDEIGYLGSSFNTMVARINHMMKENTALVSEVYEANILQKEAQINALTSQIRPHFIYNTLNMISLLIQCERNEDAVANINKLSDLLRGMAHIDKEITLETEVRLLESYLGIQSSRYSGRLAYRLEIDPRLNNYEIPSLIFQPVVENAIIHGCEKRKEKTLVRLYHSEDEHFLTFHIEDDAGGIQPETLAQLRERLAHNGKEPVHLPGPKLVAGEPPSAGTPAKKQDAGPQSGIGLVNVNRRIRIRFGETYGLEIDSTPGTGTHVQIHLPKPG